MSEAAPMEKVKAPPTGCESSETARQATVYVPFARPLSRPTRAVLARPSACAGLPVSTGFPAGSRTRTESPESETASLKVSVTKAGAVATTEFCAGSVDSSAACAEAVPAPASISASRAPRIPSSPVSLR